MIKNLRSIVCDEIFKIIILKNKINIINYLDILIFEDELIQIKSKEGLIKIKGTNLTINKLYNNELLIEGNIKSVELGD